MSKLPSAFLVSRRDDGFGDVHPLHPGTRYTLGRAPTNKITLRDDLCSRFAKIAMAATGLDEAGIREKVLPNVLIILSQYHKGHTWDDYMEDRRALRSTHAG